MSKLLSYSDIMHSSCLFTMVCNLPFMFFRCQSICDRWKIRSHVQMQVKEEKQSNVKLSPKSLTPSAKTEVSINTRWLRSQHQRLSSHTHSPIVTCSLTLDNISLQLPNFYKNKNSHLTIWRLFDWKERDSCLLIHTKSLHRRKRKWKKIKIL